MTQDTAPNKVKIVAPPRATRDRKPSSRKRSLTKPLTELFTTVGTVVYAVNPVDGQAILDGAENLAEALNHAAKTNDNLYRNLERMLTGSTWGAVIVAAGAIALPILANHGLLPFVIPGIDGPAVSENVPQSETVHVPITDPTTDTYPG